MTPPNVLCIAGHDPSGGAGLHADLEAVAAQGAHAAGVITALTNQDTRNAYSVTPLPADAFADQLHRLMQDMAFAAIKFGVLGSVEQIEVAAELLEANPQIPVVLDPVLQAGGGATLAGDPVARALRKRLLPLATIATPNAAEARRLIPQKSTLADCGTALASVSGWALVTGGDEDPASSHVVNQLYENNGKPRRYTWPRLAHQYHGSGCTLASAIAGQLALGRVMEDAVARAQQYTWECLRDGFAPGQGQHIPNRLARYRSESDE